MRVLWKHFCIALALIVLPQILLAPIFATTFFDDLSDTNGGAEAVGGNRWLGGIFKTDASTYSSLTATLLMDQSSAGTAQLRLYSDGGLVPGSLLGTFTSPANYSATLADSSFTLSGVSLSASTNYWIVLQATSGAFDWGWTSNFLTMNGWADTSDAGSTWFGDDAYPLQYKVASGIKIPGDYNGNGIVDAADYVVWRDTQGQSGSGLEADGSGNGIIDLADYTIWKANFGTSAGAGASISSITGVPELSTITLALIACATGALAAVRRARRLNSV